MPNIRRVVIFGDSLSDIGNMANRALSSAPGVVINKHGRFSDGRNWVDFFWEAISDRTMFLTDDPGETKVRSRNHLTLERANMGGGDKRMELANYAEGGATALKGDEGISGKIDKLTANKILSNLRDQVAAYLAHRADGASRQRVADANTLHVLWAGANDVVTVNRDKKYMPHVANEVVTLAKTLISTIPGSHVVIIDLPDPQFMPRFEKDSGARRQDIADAAEIFNTILQAGVEAVDGFELIAQRSNLDLFKISKILKPKEVASHGFAPFAQSKKDKLGAHIGASKVESASLLANEDIGFDEDSEFATTKDLLHPTEGVYRLIAENVLSFLAKTHYTFDG